VVSSQQVLALALTSVVIIAVPGPSVLFVVGRALAHGRSTALASVLGNSAGSLLAAVVVAIGLGPALQRWDVLLEVVRFAGAAYLVWLGVHAWRGASAPDAATSAPGAAATGSPAPSARWRAVRAGAVVGLSNPKVFVLFAAVLPQFVAPGAGPVVVQLLLLSLVPVGVGLACDSAWALLAARARGALTAHPGRLRALGRVGGASMVGLGVLTAVSGRHR
jgi:threonine/homoserine/homoserine lactone efflux protein